MPHGPDDGAAVPPPQRWSALGDQSVDRRPRRRFRRTRIALAALLGVVVVLGGVSYAGYRTGANANPADIVAGWFGAERDGTAALREQFSGRQLYETNCALCHGPAGEGGQLSVKGPAFAAGGPLAGFTFDERVAKILRGRPLRGMPRWKGKLTEAEIRRIAAYTQVLSGLDPDPSVKGVNE